MHRFQETTLELLSGVTELNFDRLNWGDDEAVQLPVVLPLCAKLATLTLIGNKVGDKGATALAVAIKGSRSLTELDLGVNKIGDEGCKAVGEALKVNVSLSTLDLVNNDIGADGGKALAEALQVNTSSATGRSQRSCSCITTSMKAPLPSFGTRCGAGGAPT